MLARHLLEASHGNSEGHSSAPPAAESEGGHAAGAASQGKNNPLYSSELLIQVHEFVFLIAAMHILSCTAMGILGYYFLSRWRRWTETDDRRAKSVREVLACYYATHSALLQQ